METRSSGESSDRDEAQFQKQFRQRQLDQTECNLPTVSRDLKRTHSFESKEAKENSEPEKRIIQRTTKKTKNQGKENAKWRYDHVRIR